MVGNESFNVWDTGYIPDCLTETVTATRDNAGGKSKKRRRKYQVEVDGEISEVSSLQEAHDVLEEVKQKAEETAKLAVERAAKAKKRSTHDVRKDARKTLQLPVIESSSFPKLADEIQVAIQKTYQSAIDSIEIALLLREAEQDEEDDEDILLLLAGRGLAQ